MDITPEKPGYRGRKSKPAGKAASDTGYNAEKGEQLLVWKMSGLYSGVVLTIRQIGRAHV